MEFVSVKCLLTRVGWVGDPSELSLHSRPPNPGEIAPRARSVDLFDQWIVAMAC